MESKGDSAEELQSVEWVKRICEVLCLRSLSGLWAQSTECMNAELSVESDSWINAIICYNLGPISYSIKIHIVLVFSLMIFVYICFISWYPLILVFYETKSFHNSAVIHGIIQEHGLQVKNRDYSIVSLALLFCWLQLTATSSAREQEKYALANRVADQVLNNVRTVLAFGKQDYEIQR